MQLSSKYNNRFLFLLCVIDIYSKYAWAVPLKYKKGITLLKLFKIFWINLGASKSNYGLIEWVLQQINELWLSWYWNVFNTNERKSAAAERFTRALKKKILQIHDFNTKRFVYKQISWFS